MNWGGDDKDEGLFKLSRKQLPREWMISLSGEEVRARRGAWGWSGDLFP